MRRWTNWCKGTHGHQMMESPTGLFVLYEDHVAALRHAMALADISAMRLADRNVEVHQVALKAAEGRVRELEDALEFRDRVLTLAVPDDDDLAFYELQAASFEASRRRNAKRQDDPTPPVAGAPSTEEGNA